jgi:CubicO group peptidase (beta-lactamase class C family)
MKINLQHKMKLIFSLALLGVLSVQLKAQLYFPPNNSSQWETISPSTLGWCQERIDSLYNFLDNNNTKAFILLKNGKIVLEKYFDEQTVSSLWYWASAGKSLTAFMLGLAQQDNYLSISDTTSKYLGKGWTSCSAEQEEKINIKHQLSMTTGLDDGVDDVYCTESSCLLYKADAGTRWAYHNGPYTLLDSVIQKASGKNLNVYLTQKLKTPTGMDGLYIKQGYNNVFFSTARSMARYGLLILNKGNWDGNQILADTSYFRQMLNSSQDLNPSYGYLWWLNGKSGYMIPQAQFVFPGSMTPNAPDDMVAAMGKNGQFLNVVPSENLVFIRMGEAPDNSLVPFLMNDQIWQYLNELSCPASISPISGEKAFPGVFPNPVKDVLYFDKQIESDDFSYSLFNSIGQLVDSNKFLRSVNFSGFPDGLYYLILSNGLKNYSQTIIKE